MLTTCEKTQAIPFFTLVSVLILFAALVNATACMNNCLHNTPSYGIMPHMNTPAFAYQRLPCTRFARVTLATLELSAMPTFSSTVL
jgi:hypothetical protein